MENTHYIFNKFIFFLGRFRKVSFFTKIITSSFLCEESFRVINRNSMLMYKTPDVVSDLMIPITPRRPTSISLSKDIVELLILENMIEGTNLLIQILSFVLLRLIQ